VSLQAFVKEEPTTGPAIVNRYNMYPSAEITGATNPGTSSGDAIHIMDSLAKRELPSSMGHEWTELSYQEIEAAKDPISPFIFPLSVLFVFLVLAAQYESWSMPFAIILIVEFAKQKQDEGLNRFDAAIQASKLRLRPILMTSFAFILGVVPLVLATGAGAEMRTALGIAVFSGMLGVTFFGIFLTPVFFFVIRRLVEGKNVPPKPKDPPLAGDSQPVAVSAMPVTAVSEVSS
jgi:multidrug efflux pump